jgi:hypothetical protein
LLELVRSVLSTRQMQIRADRYILLRERKEPSG